MTIKYTYTNGEPRIVKGDALVCRHTTFRNEEKERPTAIHMYIGKNENPGDVIRYLTNNLHPKAKDRYIRIRGGYSE